MGTGEVDQMLRLVVQEEGGVDLVPGEEISEAEIGIGASRRQGGIPLLMLVEVVGVIEAVAVEVTMTGGPCRVLEAHLEGRILGMIETLVSSVGVLLLRPSGIVVLTFTCLIDSL